MKQLTCEMCGGVDLIKTDGVFVCQNCGMKYSVEEAKKMMIEGTVEVQGTIKVDNSDKLKNYYILAKQAMDNDDYESAEKYYDLIKQEDPNSWEACFFNVYSRAMQTKILYIESAANSISNCLDTVFKLIKNSAESDTEKETHVLEVARHVLMICSMLENSSKSTMSKNWSEYATNNTDTVVSYANRALACAGALFECGNLIERDYSYDEEMVNVFCELWKSGINIWKTAYALFDDHAQRYSNMKNTYVAKLKKYQSNYSFTAPQLSGFPSQYSSFIRKNANSDFSKDQPTTTTTTTSSNNSSTSSGGCYVATAVYGSYDCPQVWTLRRFRDYTLAETRRGRAFIKTYYAISPTLVKWFGHTNWFKRLWKKRLDKMVAQLQSKGVENTPYEDKNW